MAVDIATEHGVLDDKPDLLADLAGDDLVVAGDDLDADAVLAERRNGFARCLFGGSRKAT